MLGGDALIQLRGILQRRGMARDVWIVFASNLAMQAISIASFPLLTRIFSPESYGLFAVFVIATGYLNQLAVLRYDAAVDLAKEDREAIQVLHLCFFGVLVMSLIATAFGLLFAAQAAAWVKHPEAQNIVWLLGPLLLLSGPSNIIYSWFIRQKIFLEPHLLRLGVAVFDVAVKAALGVVGFTVFGQILGSVATGVITLLAGFYLIRKHRWPVFSGWNWNAIRNLAIKHRALPFYSFPASIAELTAYSIPPIAIGIIFGPQAVGMYYIAERLVQAPTVAISSAIRPVFKIYAASQHNTGGDLRRIVGRTLLTTTPIALVFLIGAVFGLPLIFQFLFDARWENALLICQILAVSRAMDIAINAVTPVFMIFNRNRSNFFIQLFVLLGTIGSFWIASETDNLVLGVALYTGTFFCKYISELAMIVNMVWREPARMRIGESAP
jgi:lipopolysaccharide exporter